MTVSIHSAVLADVVFLVGHIVEHHLTAGVEHIVFELWLSQQVAFVIHQSVLAVLTDDGDALVHIVVVGAVRIHLTAVKDDHVLCADAGLY